LSAKLVIIWLEVFWEKGNIFGFKGDGDNLDSQMYLFYLGIHTKQFGSA